jgi:hypothetical protein
VLLVALPPQRASALLNLDGTRNQVFVFGTVTFAYSSNLFAEASARGDYSANTELGVELKRRAGIIAVNGTAKFDYQRFSHYTSENAFNPYFFIEFSKTTGRTTGSFTVSAFRESRSDSAVNLRTNSWNFPLALSIKYPLNDKFYVNSSTGYLSRRYSSNPALANYRDYSESVDLFYVYTSKLDLVGGYRVRLSKTSIGPDTTDHWFNVGATGSLVAKLNGSIRFGYQIRHITGGESFNHVNAQAELGWTVTRKFSLSGQVSRDFNTIATGASVDSTTLGLRTTYVLTRKADLEGGVAYGRNNFLGIAPQRRDHYFSWDVGGHYKFNDHLRLAAVYSCLNNSSTSAFADFKRYGFSLDLASRF